MRYFSQLARETLARVTPPRQPSWLPPMAPMVQESMVEWPAAPVVNAASEASQIPRAPELTGERVTARPSVANENVVLNPPPRSDPSMTRELRAEEPRERVEIERYFNQEADRTTPQRNFGDAAPVPLSIRLAPSPDRQESPGLIATAPLQQRVETTAPAGQPTRPATLAAVVSEIARLQQEFERRYQAEQASTRSGQSPAETARAEQRSEPASEGVSLNIGSIVVQVEPERAAVQSAPKPAPRRPPRESQNNWKRSFLDRS